MILAKLRNLDDYENISIQQLENIFPTLPAPEPSFPRTCPEPQKHRPRKQNLTVDLKNVRLKT